MKKHKLIILLAAILAVILLTGATPVASKLDHAPELKINVKKITYTQPAEDITIFWAKANEGLYKTIVGPGKTKTYPVITGNYGNVTYENNELVYFLKYGPGQKGDIYKFEMSSKKLTRLTNFGGIDAFYLKNNNIYYINGSMTIEPGVYRMSLDGKAKVRVSPTVLDEQDQKYRYYIGSGIMNPGTDVYFPLMRQLLPSTGETYIQPKEDRIYYNREPGKKREEQLSTHFFFMSDYLGDAESDVFVFVEQDEEKNVSYLHLFNKGNEIVRKIKGYVLAPVDILDGWVYFTAGVDNSEIRGLFAIRVDGSGLRQVGNNDVSENYYIGSINQNLVFKNLNEDSFTIIKAQ
jgi:hypothetical protein